MLRNKKLVWVVLGGLFCLNLIAWVVVWDLSRSQALEVTFFDIGQGDAIFIETPQGHQVLIDGGPTSAILEKLAKEMSSYDRTIDLIILTHPERDHLFGLLEVLKSYHVENILWTGIIRDTAEYQEWINLIEKEGANLFIVEAGQKIILQEDPLIFMEILHPFENLEGQEIKNSNDTSIVAHLFFDDISFLFTGDITKKVEQELIIRENSCSNSCKFAKLKSDVLKVAHHGSKTSTSPEFLAVVSPEIAVIQVGENSYGHPHPEVLANLEQFGIYILRTDKDGDIKIVSDGSNFKYEEY